MATPRTTTMRRQGDNAVKDLTIVICSYNYERFLREAIDSALAQAPERTRVIVIDDGSTDGSRAIIASYGERIVPVLKENGGQASAYNLGLELVDTEYITYLDSDDVLYDGAIDQALAAFERGGYAKVQFRLSVIDGDSRPTGAKPRDTTHSTNAIATGTITSSGHSVCHARRSARSLRTDTGCANCTKRSNRLMSLASM